MQHRPADSVCFDCDALSERASEEHYLWIDAGVIPSWARGALDEYLGSRIEERLSRVDALRRSGSVSRDFARVLEDQLYRARLVGFDGLAVGVRSLDAVAPVGLLCSDDSASLLSWVELANRGTFRLALPENLRELRGFRHSEPLSLWFRSDAGVEASEPIEPFVDSVEAEAELPSDVAASDPLDELEVALPEPVMQTGAESAEEVGLSEVGMQSSAEPEPEADIEAPREAPKAFTVSFAFEDPVELSHVEPAEPESAPTEAIASSRAGAPRRPSPEPEPLLITRRVPRLERPLGVAQIPLFSEDSSDVSAVSEEVSRANQIRELCAALSSAQGATSFAALEELFLTAYCPLEQALADDPGQVAPREVLSRWAKQFQECYEHAFERMRMSRQRPRMVFDAPKLAFQLSRVHEAPGFELVLVDAFRFDVGQRVYDKLRLQLSGQAECVERGVLWAPLPSNTAATLELLARGADGLRALKGDLKEASVVSIKEARRLRKLRVGPHSMFKLDAIQTLLEPGKSWDKKGLDQLAAEVSVSSARFIKQKPTGTLVFLFGDHGFRLGDGGHGGATPAEVLVPYQAWRVLDPARATAAE